MGRHRGSNSPSRWKSKSRMSDKTDDANLSALDKPAQILKFKAWFKADSSHSAKWRTEAKEDFDFVAGHGQWTADERSMLESSDRVPITFNRTLGFIKAVAGTEINGRHEVRYIPRTSEDTKPNELLTSASQWMSDGCDAEDEESEAFQHSMICGMGWTENRMDYETDQDGKYIEESINPLEMFWDGKARKKNLIDARRMWRARKMLLSEARQLFPDVEDDDLDARWAIGADGGDPEKSEEERRKRQDETEGYDDNCEVVVVECQWWEREPYGLVADPQTGQRVQLGLKEYETLQKRAKEMGLPIKGVKMTRRVYKRAYLGNEVLGDVEPAPCKDHFSWACITGEPDKNAGTWYGLVRIARDPQKWANKWLVQSLHILNSSAKGGIVAETDAFEDQRQAEESWAKQDRITWTKRGALSGPSPKWAQKPVSQFPAGYFNLMQFAFDAVPQVLGINMELMGLRDVNQPGVLEAQRKQAAMTILATMFDSLRRFRKLVGRIRLYFIQEYLSDGRLIRVVGPEEARSLPLLREKTLGQYDVIVDDAPTSPNQKEANWAIIVSMLPAFKDKLMENPELTIAVLENSPLPAGFVEKVKAVLMKPNPQADKQAQIAEAAAMAQIAKDQGQAKKSSADAAKVMSEIGMNPDDPQQQMIMVQDLLADIQNKMAEKRKIEAETLKTQVETAMIPAQMQMDQEDKQRQHAENARQADMNFQHKREAAKHKAPAQ